MSLESKTVLVNRFQYVYVQDNNTGQITLHEGPVRIQLESHQQLLDGIREKVRVADGQFAIVLNPYSDDKGDIIEGEREVRVGPTMFFLHPGEELEKGAVQAEYVLTDSKALLIHAMREVPHPLNLDQVLEAGEEILLKGPRRYIPHKDIRIKERRKSLSLADNQGVYVQNNDTGEVRLVKGPTDFFIEHNESLWEKHLSEEELQALGYAMQDEDNLGIRVLSATPRARRFKSEAVVVDLEDREAIYLYDGTKVRVVFGPEMVFLEPNERPKVLFISGGVLIRPNVLRIARLNLGPDFIRDRVTVRTRDNATLDLDVSFRWRFRVNQERAQDLFALKDFVGFVAKTLSAEIRAEAARHDFERFHAEAASLITDAIFGDVNVRERVFVENNLVIFGVDVESITPQDDKIKEQLSSAILTNVEIYTHTVREKATLARERELIEGKVLNEERKQQLIQLEIANERQRRLAEAQTSAEAMLVKARAEAESIRIKAQAELETEQERLRSIAALLETEGGRQYIQLEQVRVLKATDKVIVPTNSRIHLGTNGHLSEDE